MPARRSRYRLSFEAQSTWKAQLVTSIFRDDHKLITDILERKEIDLNDRKERPQRPVLFFAVQRGHYYSLQKLLRNGADPNIMDMASSKTVLHEASERCMVDVVRTLLLNNPPANINTIDAQGRTPLSLACQRAHLPIVKCLLSPMYNRTQKCNINLCDYNGRSPLFVAVEKGDLSTVKKILLHGPQLDLQTATGQTAVFRACAKGNPDVVKMLLRHYPSPNINIQTLDGMTPIMVAAFKKSYRIVEMLLNYDYDDVQLWHLTNKGKSVLDYFKPRSHKNEKLVKEIQNRLHNMVVTNMSDVKHNGWIPVPILYWIANWAY